ncbi:TPA: hypothetical protein ACOEEB_000323 [Enterobacter asburiae]|uniref:hypothetical protein n=1 Tax=Enterobacter asburiae TaxID=61645 RepID=UPI0026474A63|nr:hypothetical protein [Enterobacter asburiae]WKE08087.1 hypothetical protein QOM24_18720 [Enterobacter asburiae]
MIAQKIIDILPEAVGTIFDKHERYESIEQRNAKGNVAIANLPVKNGMKASTVKQSNVPALLPSAFCLLPSDASDASDASGAQ